MGKKKPSNREEESAAAARATGGKGKSRKKDYVIDDDEYSIGTELSDEIVVSEEKVAAVGNKKKGKKGGSKKVGGKDDYEDVGVDEVCVEEEEVEDDDAPVMKFAGKKKAKGKKSGDNSVFSASAFGLLGEGGEEEEEEKDDDESKANDDEEEEDDSAPPVVVLSGKKVSKSKKSGVGFSSAFDVLDEDEESNDKEGDEDVEISFSGKKKKKSSKELKKVIDEEDDEVGYVTRFRDDFADGGGEDQEEDVSAVKFSGKKKPSKKKSVSVDAAGEEDGNDAASSDIMKPEKATTDEVGDTLKDKKKKKKGGKAGKVDEDFDKLLAELDGAPATHDEDGNDAASSEIVKTDQHADDSSTKPASEDVAGNSKNKKKKKKTGKSGQEEDDLDKLLAEIDGAPTVSEAAPSVVEMVQSPPEVEEAAVDKEAEEEGPVESAASKKKKKKKDKEKEKEKKAAVSEEKQEESKAEINTKVLGKKVPKHVREMQERLAKLKEAEEKKKREEEERLRKEEEERRRQEELERLAEERKRLKKEREKEKLLKKKQEGKLLTGKQKEEARRLEAMRKQIMANAGMQLPTGESAEAPGKPTKRPLYQKKKSKPQTQSNGAATLDIIESTDSKDIQQETASELDFVEAENVEDVESLSTKDRSQAADVVEENGVGEEEEEEEDDDDDEEWDAKSWDDADLKLSGKSAFADEEADTEPESLVKKEIKNVENTTQNVDSPSAAGKLASLSEKVTSVLPHRSENGESKKAEGSDKNNHQVLASQDKKNDKLLAKAEVPNKPEDSPVQNGQNLRSPICCIMGHVDTGKTKLLDCIRGTNVQEGEAGGITQQIGATYFPAENIRQRTKELKADAKLNVPGLLVIDTPGHESFTNLRSRGSGLCDIAILVVDIMHGLEPQTIESLNLLKMRNTEFIVALNKVDRLYGWKTCRNAPIIKAMKQQTKDVQIEFNMRLTQIITQFKEQGLNTELYYKNKEMGETFSIVPTSAISGEGVPDLLLLLVQWTQKTMIKRLTYSDEVQCTVLEVKVVEGHGTTIDVVLVNGVLHEGDQIVVCGLQGPIVTTIRALLTPHPMRELRVKGAYLHHKEIKAAQGIKITAQGLEHAIAGTSLYVVGPDDDLEDIKEAAMEDMESMMSRIDKSGEGVYVQASTLGSLEALLEFLKTPAVNIPVSGISIGPVHKKDVMKASVMLEKKKEYGTILAFDVKVTPEARDLADELGVKIFIADIIYHLFDQFKAYIDNLKEEKRKQAADEAVFPCVLKIIPNCVFNKKDPIVLGVDVLEGMAKVGTPICVPQKEFIEIGRIASIENNHKAVDYAKKGQQVAIKIIGSNPDEQQKMFGRHFEIEDELVSRITRNSLDALKEHYADDLSTEEKRLLFKLKRLFKIP